MGTTASLAAIQPVTDIIMDSELESYAYKTTMQLAQVKIFLLRDTFEELTVTKIHWEYNSDKRNEKVTTINQELSKV